MSALHNDSVTLLSTTSIADMSGATERTIYTVPTGKTCILAFAFLEADGDLADAGIVTIGTTGAGSESFVGTTNVDNLDADGDVILIAPVPSATPAVNKAYAAGSVIILDIATAAAAETATCYLFGFLY